MEFLIIILGIIIDRIVKTLSINNLKYVNGREIIKGLLDFYYLENRGAAFSILEGKVPLLVISTSIVIIAIMAFLIIQRKKLKILEKISLSLILSGAIGNMIDRIYYGYVVDFIKVHYQNKYVFPIFNIADILVTVGVAIFIFITLLGEKDEK